MTYKLFFILLSVFSAVSLAQTSSMLKQDDKTKNFAKVVPGVSIDFPVDHFPHPDFRIEWWYFTANVWDKDDNHYGLQFTLFRQALSPANSASKDKALKDSPWLSRQSWMAHSAISSQQGHLYEERFARGGIGQGGVQFNPQHGFEAWLDDWQWQGQDPVNSSLSISVKDYTISLKLSGESTWVKHGENGFSQKSASEASYYYSHPDITVDGVIETTNGKRVKIKGQGWLDREWSSQFLTQQQKGWDWFSLQLDDGARLMLFQLRDAKNKSDFKSGTWIDQYGNKTKLSQKDIHLIPLNYSQVNNRDVPTKWKLEAKKINRSWTVQAFYENSWLDTLFPYWEGPIKMYNADSKREVGVGFLEMTGY